MTLDLKNLFGSSHLIINLFTYLFHPNPGKAFNYYIILIILAVLLLALAVIISILVKKAKEDKAFRRLFRSFPKKFITIDLCLIFYLACRYTQIPFFSTRILLFIILAVIALMFIMIINTYINKYPPEKKKYEEQEEKNKYIPHRHHKR